MKFGIEFVPNEPVAHLSSYAKIAENAGFDFVWVTDHSNNRDVYATLAAISLATQRIFVGAGVTNPYTRNPAVTASAIATIYEISGGRAVLGIGPGDKSTFETLGISGDKPLTAIRECVSVFSDLFLGKTVSFDGEMVSLKGARIDFAKKMMENLPALSTSPVAQVSQISSVLPNSPSSSTSSIPVYVGAQGPKMLEMAGEVAAGVLINASHPDDFKAALPLIENGSKKANRNLKDIDIAAYTCFSMDDDSEAAIKKAAPVVAFIVVGAPDLILVRHGINPEIKKELAAEISKSNFKALGGLVSDKMIDKFAIAGDAGFCEKRMKELEKSGVTQIVVGSPIGADKEKTISGIGEIIRDF
ncbi:5,10-methylenetetrahydromethanopterin reductase [Methanolapillus ohkumae]|uniref:5,10-methylenetetrahydromethanopterin reductase n=1 Tax=Methanolapillus ohkumae TaxID=3028298 RepID=A0AA96V572_9EURY|nr:Phthiodiolone/phenolphthiodiolone dimycocerosates ketoreductase [Methanosarcinaceae archaeon Am2]